MFDIPSVQTATITYYCSESCGWLIVSHNIIDNNPAERALIFLNFHTHHTRTHPKVDIEPFAN